MGYPRLIIDKSKILHNVKTLVDLTQNCGIEIAGVTKGFCAYRDIVDAYIEGGVKYLADSRIDNLKKLESYDLPKILLRLPMISETDDVVRYSDFSLNSEVDTIKALSDSAIKLNRNHGVILMVDLGDLREGFFSEAELYKAIEEIIKLPGIDIIGLGVNFTCYGGVRATKKLSDKLVRIGKEIENKFNINLEIISGGNSSSVYLLGKEDVEGVNNLRLGEALICGTESAFGERINGTYDDAFTLEAEIIEIKDKPSVPTEEIGRDAFGKVPTFIDRGVRRRILCAIGKQDVDFDTIYPYDKDLIILGGSSDHLILDSSDSDIQYKIGDIVKFNIHYVSILRLMTSEYIDKITIY